MQDKSLFPDFSLDPNTGEISMKEGIKLEQELKVYNMEFRVEDPTHGQVESWLHWIWIIVPDPDHYAGSGSLSRIRTIISDPDRFAGS